MNSMMTEKQIKFFIVMFCGLLVASCSHYSLPDDWSLPKTVSGSGCPDISGTYSAAGTCADKDSELIKSAGYIGQKYWKDATHFTIKQDQCSMRVSALKGKYVVWSEVFSMKSGDFACEDDGIIKAGDFACGDGGIIKAGDFECEDGWITIANYGGGLYFSPNPLFPLLIGGGGKYNRFARTGDYLLMKLGDEGGGVVFLAIIPVPIVASFSDWCRYPILNKTEGPTPKEEEKE